MIARDPVVETPAEATLAAGIGIDIGTENEMGPIAAHANLGLGPRIPIQPLVVDPDGYRGLGRERIVPGDGEFLDLAVGNHGADIVDAVGSVAPAVAHDSPVGADVVEGLPVLDSRIEDSDGHGLGFL